MIRAGNIYGVTPNDRLERARLSAEFELPPYKASPKSPVVYMKPARTVAACSVRFPGGQPVVAAPTLALLFARKCHPCRAPLVVISRVESGSIMMVGIDTVSMVYGMSEGCGFEPRRANGIFHTMPPTVPFLFDRDMRLLPYEGKQTERYAFFDLQAETYWGGFISGDQVTIDWEEGCGCGWKGPVVGPVITRFAEMEGGDDKISCAGKAQAYNDFMGFVSQAYTALLAAAAFFGFGDAPWPSAVWDRRLMSVATSFSSPVSNRRR